MINYGQPNRLSQVLNIPTKVATVTAEAVTIPAGAAGTLVTVPLQQRPVLNATSTDIAGTGDTSLALTSLVLTTETNIKEDADLANGEFYVDYVNGRIRGRKATTGTTGTATYNTSQVSINSTSNSPSAALGDGAANPTTGSVGANVSFYNGSTWDRGRSGISTIVSSVTGMQNVLPMGQYRSSPGTLTDNQMVMLQVDSTGSLRVVEQKAPGSEDNTNGVTAIAPKPMGGVATYAWSAFANYGANATLNVKGTAANVYSVYCHNLNAAIRYIQLHNTATVPAGGAVPIKSYLVKATDSVFIGSDILGQLGDVFTLGVAFAFSTTEGTYTAGAAGDQVTEIQFK